MSAINKILLVIAGIVSLLIPVANMFPAYVLSFPSVTDSSMINPQADPMYFSRFIIISAGLFLTAVSLILFLFSGIIPKQKNKLLNLSVFVYVFVVGWMFIPYWANGLFDVIGNETNPLPDPNGLLPMYITGEIWRLPIVVLYPFVVLYIIFSLVRFVVITIKNQKTQKQDLFILVFNLLTIAAHVFTPNYFYWLFD